MFDLDVPHAETVALCTLIVEFFSSAIVRPTEDAYHATSLSLPINKVLILLHLFVFCSTALMLLVTSRLAWPGSWREINSCIYLLTDRVYIYIVLLFVCHPRSGPRWASAFDKEKSATIKFSRTVAVFLCYFQTRNLRG